MLGICSFTDIYIYIYICHNMQPDYGDCELIMIFWFCLHTVRLINGRFPTEGQLEIYHSGRWGTVAYRATNQHVAQVVCHILGYTGGESYKSMDYTRRYGCENDHIIQNLRCSGKESSLLECNQINWATPNVQLYGRSTVITCGEWHM